MEIGIIGLPQSGKKTLFQILTNLDPLKNKVGISRINDPRLDFLNTVFKPAKTVLSEIGYSLLPDIVNNEKENDSTFRTLLNLDSFILVIRAFDDDSVYHIKGSVDPLRDLRNFMSDIILKDIMFLEKRIESLSLDIRKKPTDYKKKELKLAIRIKEYIEKEKPIRTMDLSVEDNAILSPYQFLTDKKIMVVINYGESANIEESVKSIQSSISDSDVSIIGVSAKVELEIAGLDDESMKKEFMKDMGITESTMDKVIRMSHNSLGLQLFFTASSKEVRAWSVIKNSSILAAARKIHQDIEKGFIRAEVIKYKDITKYGSINKIKEAGLFHLKGKDYTVEDGDIITFRFNV